MAFALSDYQTVQERINLLWERYPNARYEIDIVSMTDGQVVMRCRLWTDAADEHPRTIDFAEERIGTSNVNKISHVENCATSVLGRAISGLGGDFSPKGKRPSREEMEKVQRHVSQPVPTDLSDRLTAITARADLGTLYEIGVAEGWMNDEVRALFTARKNELVA
jgi:hypothetical protein